MSPQLARVVHQLGVIAWVGGALAAATVAAFAAGSDEGRLTALRGAHRALVWWATPGMVLAWAGGLTMLLPAWSRFASAGWMHGKLTHLLVLSALTGVLSARIRKAAAGQREPSARFFNAVAVVLLAAAFVILALVVLKPGGA